MSPLEERAVLPFYLKMMGLNAIWTDPVAAMDDEARTRLIHIGRSIDLLDVKWLLNVGAWRPVVMGAWFSLRFSATEIGTDLRHAMRASAGSLTAPPLATACVLVVGTTSLPDLEHYVQNDPGQDGSARFVAAAAERLGSKPTAAITDDSYRDRLGEMLDLGTRLQSEFARGH